MRSCKAAKTAPDHPPTLAEAAGSVAGGWHQLLLSQGKERPGKGGALHPGETALRDERPQTAGDVGGQRWGVVRRELRPQRLGGADRRQQRKPN